LRDIPERIQQALDVGSVEEVTFVEQSADVFRYRDAVRFANGRETLLQQLACGQSVLVLRLDAAGSEVGESESIAVLGQAMNVAHI
jgi:hypothetical protein